MLNNIRNAVLKYCANIKFLKLVNIIPIRLLPHIGVKQSEHV